MKLAFLLLVLVNLLLFAWQQGAFGRFAEPGREPERVARQIDPERFRVLTEADVRELRERATQGSAPLDLDSAQACVDFGDFPAADAARVEKTLAALSPGVTIESRPVDVPGWYMVYLPPHKTLAEAERRADELRRLGVKDLLVMSENAPLKFAISLGSFRDPDAAKSHLVALEKLGVKGVRMSDRSSAIVLTRFRLRGLDAAASRQLATLRGEFPAQALRPCSSG
jgi:hypothetical protein